MFFSGLECLSSFHSPHTDDVDYHNDCISKKTLAQLSSDVAKLKAKSGIEALNKSKLTLLINFAMRNVDVVKNLSAGPVSIRSEHVRIFVIQ